MDYSLLLAVEKLNQDKVKKEVVFKKSDFIRKLQASMSTKSNFDFDEIGLTKASLIGTFSDQRNTLKNQIVSSCGQFVYHISIIDYLQTYTLSKKVERWYKASVLKFKNTALTARDISSVPPATFEKRFLKFMKNEVFSFY